MRVPWGSHGDPTGIPWGSHGGPMGVPGSPWGSLGFLGGPWESLGVLWGTKIVLNFDHFFDAFLGRFLVAFGAPSGGLQGVILATLAVQEGPSWVSNPSWKLILSKSVVSQLFASVPSEKLNFGFPSPQDGAPNGPRSPQEAPKRVSEGHFFALKFWLDF